MNKAGRPEIVTNDEGQKLTNSAVLVREDGVIQVGQYAYNDHALYCDRVETAFKRKMDEPLWRGPEADAKYSAIDFSTFVLKKLKQDAEKRIGKIKKAVISVPAYFSDESKKATIKRQIRQVLKSPDSSMSQRQLSLPTRMQVENPGRFSSLIWVVEPLMSQWPALLIPARWMLRSWRLEEILYLVESTSIERWPIMLIRSSRERIEDFLAAASRMESRTEARLSGLIIFAALPSTLCLRTLNGQFRMG